MTFAGIMLFYVLPAVICMIAVVLFDLEDYAVMAAVPGFNIIAAGMFLLVALGFGIRALFKLPSAIQSALNKKKEANDV